MGADVNGLRKTGSRAEPSVNLEASGLQTALTLPPVIDRVKVNTVAKSATDLLYNFFHKT